MLTLLAASLAPLHRARRYVLFLIVVTVIALMIAYTIPPVSWVVAHTPFLKSMKNGRFIFVASFGIAAMAGLGISVLQESETALIGRKRKYAWGLIGVAFAGVIVAISRLQLATQVEATLMRRPSFSVFLSCAALAILACALSGRMKKPLFEAITISFVVFDLLTFSYGFTGFSSTRSIYSAAPVFDFLNKNADASHVRVVQVGNSYSANVAMMYGFAGADGYEVCLERPRLFASGLSQDRQDGIFLVADGIVNSTDRRFDMLNVKYLVVSAGSPESQKFSEHSDRFSTVFARWSCLGFRKQTRIASCFSCSRIRSGSDSNSGRGVEASQGSFLRSRTCCHSVGASAGNRRRLNATLNARCRSDRGGGKQRVSFQDSEFGQIGSCGESDLLSWLARNSER